MTLQMIVDVLDCLPDPVLLVDDALVVAGMNSMAIRRYGAASVDRPLFGMIRQPQALECIEQARAATATREVVITEIVHQTESKIRLVVTPLTLADPPFSGLVLSLTDITMVQGAEKARKDFVANVSHELKSPLTTLIGFIDTIGEDPNLDAGTLNGFLDVMKAESARMSRLVSELLTLSKVEAQEYVLPTERVQICQLVSSLVDRLTCAANGCTDRIAVTDCTEQLSIIGDDDQLRQVFSNLLDNALKYSPSGSPVEVRCLRSGKGKMQEFVIIEVIDQGHGIDAEHLPRLTERFYRIDSHRTREQGGAGLGLAIVKHIINRHRGRLEVSSVPGTGSTFRVELPLVPDLQSQNALPDDIFARMT